MNPLFNDEAMQSRVLSLVDHAHTADAKFLDDAVVRDGLAITGANLTFAKRASQ